MKQIVCFWKRLSGEFVGEAIKAVPVAIVSAVPLGNESDNVYVTL